MKGRNSTNYVVGRQRLQIPEPHFDMFPTPQTFSCWKIRFKTEVCSCSNFPTKAMLWIKEVELVESGDDSKSSRSIQGITRFPDFELLDARIDGANFFLWNNSPPDDMLESLHKLRIRESEKLKIVLELYNLEIHQKKSKPDNHRLKTMVKRSIEQDLRTKGQKRENRVKHAGQESKVTTSCSKRTR